MSCSHGSVDIALAQLDAVLALAEHGSFTRAAAALGRTQSAVSRSIGLLERRLGAPVAHRGAAVTLTVTGEEVAEHARAVRGHLEAVAALARVSEAADVRVGAIISATVRLVPTIAARFRTGRVWVAQGDDDEVAAWFAAGTVDVAVSTWGPAEFPTADVHLSRPDDFLAVLPARHPLAAGARVGLRALVQAGVADPGGTCGPQLSAGYLAHGESWVPAHVVRDVGTVLSMAAAGITVGVLPAISVPDPVPAGVVLRPLDPPLGRTVHVHHRSTPGAADLAGLLVRPLR